MSRPLRIEYEDAYYHVMNRGRGRQKIFHGDDYFHAFLATLSEAHERFGLEVHAYCMMSNHYHLLVKTPQANLQRAMRHIGSQYSQRYNRLKRTDGPLFRGRYKAITVDHDAYLLHLSQYIHRNPLEAKTTRQLDTYVWSSYPAYIGKATAPSWLYQEAVLSQLNIKRRLRQKYQAYVLEEDILPEVSDFYSKAHLAPILGDEGFVARIKALSKEANSELTYRERQTLKPSITKIVLAVSEYYKIPTAALYLIQRGRGYKNRPRKTAMYLAQRVGGYRLGEIAEAFGLAHYGGVSNAIFMIKQEMDEDTKLSQEINTIINRLGP